MNPIQARYAGSCPACGKTYAVGSQIIQHKAGWGHLSCPTPRRAQNNYLAKSLNLKTHQDVWADFIPSEYQQNLKIVFESTSTHLVVKAVAGSGKCLGIDTPVMLASGEVKSVQNIQVGDLLMGPDSTPRKVMSTTIGHGKLVKIIPVKGDSWVCNEDHILTLAGTNRFNGQILDISVKEYQRRCIISKSFYKDWKLVRCPVNEFVRDHHNLEIEPYFLGLWLGDGTHSNAEISNPDKEIIDYCVNVAHKYGTIARLLPDTGSQVGLQIIRFVTGTREDNSQYNFLRRYFKKISINGVKTLPGEYLYSTRSNRLELLAGLLDTDGYYNNGYYEIIQKDNILANQIVFLARSLGFAAYIVEKVGTIKNIGFVGKYWRITISGAMRRHRKRQIQ